LVAFLCEGIYKAMDALASRLRVACIIITDWKQRIRDVWVLF